MRGPPAPEKPRTRRARRQPDAPPTASKVARGVDPRETLLRGPKGLSAKRFRVGPDEFALLSFPLPAVSVPEKLAPVEKLVVAALLEGKSNLEIARERGVALNTVLNQLKSIFRKLGVSSRWELAAMCREH